MLICVISYMYMIVHNYVTTHFIVVVNVMIVYTYSTCPVLLHTRYYCNWCNYTTTLITYQGHLQKFCTTLSICIVHNKYYVPVLVHETYVAYMCRMCEFSIYCHNAEYIQQVAQSPTLGGKALSKPRPVSKSTAAKRRREAAKKEPKRSVYTHPTPCTPLYTLHGGYAPIYPLLPWLLWGVTEGYVTMVAEDIQGAYPPSRCGISDLYHMTASLYYIRTSS